MRAESYYGIDFTDDPKPKSIPTDSGLIDEGPGIDPEQIGLEDTGPYQERNRVSIDLYRIATLSSQATC